MSHNEELLETMSNLTSELKRRGYDVDIYRDDVSFDVYLSEYKLLSASLDGDDLEKELGELVDEVEDAVVHYMEEELPPAVAQAIRENHILHRSDHLSRYKQE